jgi:hypothetical protein
MFQVQSQGASGASRVMLPGLPAGSGGNAVGIDASGNLYKSATPVAFERIAILERTLSKLIEFLRRACLTEEQTLELQRMLAADN